MADFLEYLLKTKFENDKGVNQLNLLISPKFVKVYA